MISQTLPARTIALLATALLAIGVPARAQEDWHARMARPDSAFSQVPFWFWNDALDDTEIKRQLADFREHGVFGFVIHPRMGLPADIPYMSAAWLAHVRTAVDEAARTGMHVCLYDEAMYPSGSAHGEVVRTHPEFAAKGLLTTYTDIAGPTEISLPAVEGTLIARSIARLTGEKTLDGDSIRMLDGTATTVQVGQGRWRLMTFSCVPSRGSIRGVHQGEESGQPGAPPAADLLDPAAMQCFIRLTHDRYYAAFKEHFGKTIFAMFTDEPSMLGRNPRKDLKPWTPGLESFFEKKRGYALAPLLPALCFDAGAKSRSVQADFEITLVERLNDTYYRPLSEWCERHGIALTGHPGASDDIALLRFFQIPGQDVVWRQLVPGSPAALEGPESTMAKCTSSVARQDGRRFNTNECLGAFGWNLTVDEMKWLADWLMVRGVNMLMPHAFYYSIRGDRVNERPPDVGPHNAWWPHYRLLADYTARVTGLVTDSRPICDVAILVSANHPTWRAARYLLRNQIDFDYLEDQRLTQKARIHDGCIEVGPMTYKTIIVDQDAPPAKDVQTCLDAFKSSGGSVVQWRSDPPPALPAEVTRGIRATSAAADLRCLSFTRNGVTYHLLTNEGEQPIDTDILVKVRGKAEWFDAWTGQFAPAPMEPTQGDLLMTRLHLDRRQSRILCIAPGQPAGASPVPAVRANPSRTLAVAGPWKVLDAQNRQVADRLEDWLKLPALSSLAGTLRYETTIPLDPRTGCSYELDLGQVGDWAVVRVNGESFGPRLWSPFVWDITPVVKDGPNTLSVDVTNSLANRLAPDKRRPSGLMGPVTIREVSPAKN